MLKILLSILGFLTGKLLNSLSDSIDSEVSRIQPASVVVTFAWIKIKVNEKFADKSVAKVAVANIPSLLKNYNPNEVNPDTFKSLKELADSKCDYLIAAIDARGEVLNAEVFQDLSTSRNEQVEHLVNSTGDGMVVIER